MAIKFEQQVKKQRNLIILFVILILAAGFVLWWGFRVEQEPLEILISRRLKSVEINLDIFNHPLLKQFQLIDKTPSFEGELGRENPVIPL